jgi:hypothetical protein
MVIKKGEWRRAKVQQKTPVKSEKRDSLASVLRSVAGVARAGNIAVMGPSADNHKHYKGQFSSVGTPARNPGGTPKQENSRMFFAAF